MVSTLTPDTAAALDGPSWLSSRRAEAAVRAAGTPIPSPSEEVWRYSRIAELQLDRYAAPARPADGLPGPVERLLAAVPERGALVVLRNGWLVHCEVSDAAARAGLVVVPFAELGAEDAPADLADLGPTDLFGMLAQGHAPSPVLVDVPSGASIDAPIVVVEWIDEPDVVAPTHLRVRLGAGAHARLLQWQASDAVASLGIPLTEVEVGPGAGLGHLTVQTLSDQAWQIAETRSLVEGQASLVAAHAGLGGDYARSRTDCRLVGRGASGTLLALYFGEGAQTLDYRTFQEHVAPDTTSDLLYKGAVSGTSRSVYSGLIRVGPEARGTNAFQTNRNIKLADGAWAESVPNLEINHNDVRCSHATATVFGACTRLIRCGNAPSISRM